MIIAGLMQEKQYQDMSNIEHRDINIKIIDKVIIIPFVQQENISLINDKVINVSGKNNITNEVIISVRNIIIPVIKDVN